MVHPALSGLPRQKVSEFFTLGTAAQAMVFEWIEGVT